MVLRDVASYSIVYWTKNLHLTGDALSLVAVANISKLTGAEQCFSHLSLFAPFTNHYHDDLLSVALTKGLPTHIYQVLGNVDT